MTLVPAALEPLPPSAKLVYVILDREAPLTHSGIQQYTKLPKRTTDEALGRLSDEGLIQQDPNYDDAREVFYRLDR